MLHIKQSQLLTTYPKYFFNFTYQVSQVKKILHLLSLSFRFILSYVTFHAFKRVIFHFTAEKSKT